MAAAILGALRTLRAKMPGNFADLTTPLPAEADIPQAWRFGNLRNIPLIPGGGGYSGGGDGVVDQRTPSRVTDVLAGQALGAAARGDQRQHREAFDHLNTCSKSWLARS
jgi:hypothetical protein